MAFKILLVDDQAFVRHIYSADLRNQGYEVSSVEDGKKALNVLSQSVFDLILLDAMMPGIDGFDTCLQIRANPNTKSIPVIFLTANADKKSVIRAVQSGANDFFVKGPETASLVQKISKILSEVKK